MQENKTFLHKKNFLLVIFFIIHWTAVCISAQTKSIQGYGDINDDGGRSIAIDKRGNVYVTGYFQGSITIDNTTLVSKGSFDVFIVKYNSIGSVEWAVSHGNSQDDIALGIAVDSNDNAYITGFFQGTTNFGSTILRSNGGIDIFIVKYNSAGVLQWANGYGGISTDAGWGITTDKNGNVYCTGEFGERATFAENILQSQGGSDIFILKCNTNGVLQWVRSHGGAGNDNGNDIAVDNDGNIFTTGFFTQSARFGTTLLQSQGEADIFLAKYNSNGFIQQVVQHGGIGRDEGRGIALDEQGQVYISGYFNATVSFSNMPLVSRGNLDAFVAKYNSSLIVQWAVSYGYIQEDVAFGVTTDNNGGVYTTGHFQGKVDFDSVALISERNSWDAYIVRHNTSSGAIEWITQSGGKGNDTGFDVAVDKEGRIYTTGFFSDTATFTQDKAVSKGKTDIFVWFNVNNIAIVPISSNIIVYPNPVNETATFAGSLQGREASITLYDNLGKEVYFYGNIPLTNGELRYAIATAHLANGSYTAELQSDTGDRVIVRLIIVK